MPTATQPLLLLWDLLRQPHPTPQSSVPYHQSAYASPLLYKFFHRLPLRQNLKLKTTTTTTLVSCSHLLLHDNPFQNLSKNRKTSLSLLKTSGKTKITTNHHHHPRTNQLI